MPKFQVVVKTTYEIETSEKNYPGNHSVRDMRELEQHNANLDPEAYVEIMNQIGTKKSTIVDVFLGKKTW